MLHICAKNVNEAYYTAVKQLRVLGQESDSRNGKVLAFPYPLLTECKHPRERVLFCPNRNANPFFHLMESLWMLDGRRDVKWVSQFNKRMADYSDDGRIIMGAYGYRWRHQFGMDQIEIIIKKILANPLDRRIVLEMWDPNYDLVYSGKDVPCNTHVYFRVVKNCLDMTVCNRSNDIIWGLYGANAVHMSLLQEYIASSTGLGLGRYYTLSNNAHAYLDVLAKVGAPELTSDYYSYDAVTTNPLFGDVNKKTFDADLWTFMDTDPRQNMFYSTPFFNNVAQPMAQAWTAYKNGDWEYVWVYCAKIGAEDWNIAGTKWMERKHAAYIRTDAQAAE